MNKVKSFSYENFSSFYSPYSIGMNQSFCNNVEFFSKSKTSGYSCDSNETKIKSFCEYFERLMFLTPTKNEFKINKKNTLLIKNKIWKKSVYDINLDNKIINDLNCYKVINYYTGEIGFLPKGLITFANLEREDRIFSPFIDTTGNAVHTNLSLSILASGLELIERQCMLLAWHRLTPSGESYLLNHNDLKFLKIPQEIINLLDIGELHLGNISSNFSAFTFICTFKSKNINDIVQFSIGASSSLSSEKAIKSAILELYSTYIFVKNSCESTNNLDQLKINFLKKNNINSHNEFSCFIEPSVKFNKSIIDQVEYKESEFFESIKNVTNNLFLYTRPFKINSLNFWGTRLMSPDFFLHINTELHQQMPLICSKNEIFELKKGIMPFP